MKKFITEIEKEDGVYGDYVYGSSFVDAQENADLLKVGKVIGELMCTIDAETGLEIDNHGK